MNSKVTSSRLTSTPPPSHEAYSSRHLDPLTTEPKPGAPRRPPVAQGATMAIQSGDPIPNATFTVMAPDGPQLRTTDQIFKGHKVVLFGVAGAFTPVCDKHHLPGFLDNLDQFKAQGVDEIAVTGFNDVFVKDAWAKSAGANGKITFLADGNGDFARPRAFARSHCARARHPLAALCDDSRRWRGTKAQRRSGPRQGRNIKRGSPAEA